MTSVYFGALFLITLGGMEIFAYVMHRWVMHGVGWFLHASHHKPRKGIWEWNDLYGAIFALPSIALLYMGARQDWGWPAIAIGAGIAGYGFIYFVFHDFWVHQRIPHRINAPFAYARRLRQAHQLHHAVGSRKGAVSFGFLYAPPIRDLRQQLRMQKTAELRAVKQFD